MRVVEAAAMASSGRGAVAVGLPDPMAMGPQESVEVELVHLEQAEPLTLVKVALEARLAQMVVMGWNLAPLVVAAEVEAQAPWLEPEAFMAEEVVAARQVLLTLGWVVAA
jgi:hypothetical protein